MIKNKIFELFKEIDPNLSKAFAVAEDKKWNRPPLADQNLYRPGNEYPLSDLPLKPSAVLIPLIQKEGKINIILTKRSEKLRNHSGQVSFPGGRCDATDINMADTALREAEEEIGLSRSHVEIIGAMDDYETVTGFSVTPVVGFIETLPELVPDPTEVESVFDVDLDFILDEANHQVQSRVWQNKERHFYVFPHAEYYIWGATAAMLVRFAKTIKEHL